MNTIRVFLLFFVVVCVTVLGHLSRYPGLADREIESGILSETNTKTRAAASGQQLDPKTAEKTVFEKSITNYVFEDNGSFSIKLYQIRTGNVINAVTTVKTP